jgi:inosine-uridine nucleoside N-ribohydrolase
MCFGQLAHTCAGVDIRGAASKKKTEKKTHLLKKISCFCLMEHARIQVILDTDIGDDMDDTWALALLLRMSDIFDLRLVVTGGFGHHRTRALVAAKFLTVCGKKGIPIGLGWQEETDTEANGENKYFGKPLSQGGWAADYDIASYEGEIVVDGVQLLIDTVLASKCPLTLISIGPCGNISEALRREPHIASKLHFVGMHGSISQGYGAGSPPVAEYNVVKDVAACRACFQAPFITKSITPLDTCALIRIKDSQYQRLLGACSSVPMVKALIDSYRGWYESITNPTLKKVQCVMRTCNVMLLFSLASSPPSPPATLSAYIPLRTISALLLDRSTTPPQAALSYSTRWRFFSPRPPLLKAQPAIAVGTTREHTCVWRSFVCRCFTRLPCTNLR